MRALLSKQAISGAQTDAEGGGNLMKSRISELPGGFPTFFIAPRYFWGNFWKGICANAGCGKHFGTYQKLHSSSFLFGVGISM